MLSNIEHKRNLGSAAMMLGDQKLLFIFVNDSGAEPWTTQRRKSVEEKIERSLRWLEDKAKTFGVALRFQHVSVPVAPSMACDAGGHIDENDYCAGPGHSTWQNHVVAGLTHSGSVATCWDELFINSGLPLKAAEGSAVVFCVRRYVPSVAFPFFKGEHTEFERERAIIYDNGGEGGQLFLDSLIAHELLHLYGAVDLAPNKAHSSLKGVCDQYADDVMHSPTQRPIERYEIGGVTAYLIGWLKTPPANLAGI